MWYLIGVVWIALITGIIWSFRRKKARRDAERARQFDALYADLKLSAATPAAGERVVPTAPAPPTAAAAVAAPAYRSKARLLGSPHALLYRVFRAGLPDHEIFVNVALADAVEIADLPALHEREQRTRMLARLKLDLIVCSKQFEVLAAVMLTEGQARGAEDAENARFIDQALRAAGIRVIAVGRDAIPRHHQVRALVFGGTP